jgi:hypothetical protein
MCGEVATSPQGSFQLVVTHTHTHTHTHHRLNPDLYFYVGIFRSQFGLHYIAYEPNIPPPPLFYYSSEYAAKHRPRT